ncbi:efflux RND transporter periplasmic adaptor subunit [Paracoccus sp. 1_MG-2023]|uniref:efflux RND transporter periplasmic adaptor subunit n=1 Tax=unclassified Paracoccus (in: a-proteobacteria) TaxID=2688777 RepID=UPI001C09FB82|nr:MULTISPECIES: efflux RND transporter periplasmic adaptor subunit [unclassified Paracoccus (in: a-proteobacteria)]MBU2958186.1 efflux RND transporter periplasmic adaptor subunit [Paracoccus sp. C2R09]MDO6668313.1 efflux RND transporter periplasmic adaptor subunit [Paracoccus sp. 1_MG-2023]
MRDFIQMTGAALGASMMLASVGFAQGMPPKTVGVMQVEEQDVPRIFTLPGRAVAANAAEIRPRVSGIVTEVLYEPGQEIAKGTPMFRIDATTYEAGVAAAQADLAAAQATLTEAESSLSRNRALLGSGATQAAVDSAQATRDQAQAQVDAAEAALVQAQAELDWTTVTSPLDGIASVADTSIGDLVTANQADAMATVTQLDPVEVDMYEPSSRFLTVLDDISDGSLRLNEELRATLTLENGRTYQAVGELIAPGVTVSTSTGSIDTRFRFDNPEKLILPGMFLRGQVDLGVTTAILVPQTAATRDKIGQLSAWVIKDGKATRRDLTTEGSYQNQWIVIDGLEDGETLVVEGASGLSEGAEVQTAPVVIDENGVIRDAPQPEAE